MKKTILSILLLAITFSYAQFEATWEMNLSNSTKEMITLTKNNDKVIGSFLIDGGKLNATYNKTDNKLNGYFRYNRKIYKFKAFIKNNTNNELIVGKYCACSGEPNLNISFRKQKKFSNADWINMEENQTIANIQGTWTSTFGELRLHQNGNKITGDYKNVGVINATVSKDIVKGTFTNGNNTGHFEWALVNNNKKFTGIWAWKGKKLGGSWNGTLKSSTKPTLKNTSTSNSTGFNNFIKTDREVELFIRLQKKAHQTAEKTIKQIKAKGFKNVDIIVAFLKKHYQLTAQETINAFKNSGYQVNHILSAIKNRFNTNASTMVNLAKSVNYNANDIARSLEKDYNYKQAAIIKLLKSKNFNITQIGNVLTKVFSVNGYTAAKIMKTANLEADFIFKVLKTQYNSSYTTVAKIAKDILKFDAYKTAYNLYKVYNLKANQVASALYNNAKYGFDECVSAVMKIYKMGKTSVLDLLT